MDKERTWLPTMQASLKKGKTVINGRNSAPENGADETGNRADNHPQHELAVPIKLADEMLGVFGFSGDDDVLWEEEEISAVEAVVEQVGLALEKQRLYEQTQKALAETEALYAGNGRIAQASTVEQVLNALTETTALKFMEEVNLVFFDQAWEKKEPAVLSIVATLTPPDQIVRFPAGTELPFAEYDFLREINRDSYTHYPDIHEAEEVGERVRQQLGELDMVSVAVFPLVAGQQWIGLLTGFSAHPFLFTEDELRQINTLTNQASNVIQNLILFAETRERAAELAVLNEMARVLAAELSVDQIIGQTYRYINRLLNTTETYIALYDEETDEVDVRILGEGEEVVESALRRRGGNGITELIIRRGAPLLLPVVTDTTPQEYGYEIVGRQSKSWLGVPMLIGSRRLGVIAVQDFEHFYRFNNHDQELLTAIAGQTAISLQNANLFDQTENALAETQTLYDVSARLNSAVGLQEVLLAAISPATDAGASSAGLWIFDNDGGDRPVWQELAAVWGNIETSPLNQPVRVRLGEMPLASAWGSGKTEPVFIADVYESERVDENARAIFNVLGARSTCSLPLLTGTRQVGAITMSWPEPRQFDNTEKRLYRNIAAQTAEVVEGRLLLQAAQERTVQLEMLSRIEADLSQAVDEAGILEAVVANFEDIPHAQLRYVYLSADNQPESSALVAEWSGRQAGPVSGERLSLLNDLLAPLWLSHPHDIRAIPDVRRDNTLDDERRETLLAQNIRAISFLPFYSGARWHGVMFLTWPHPFTLTPVHRFVLRRLLEPVGASLASRRAQLAQQEALNETATLYRAIAALNAARSYGEILQVLKQFSALGRESAIMVYHRFDRPWTETQKPEWFDVPARLTKVKMTPLAPRYRFADSPAVMQLRPDRPIWIENIATDPRLDEAARANLSGRTQMKSVIFVPLVYGGEWTGNLVAYYSEPRRFPAEAVRQFTGLGTQAAIAIQNLRLVEEAQQRAQREQLLRRITERVRNATEAPAIIEIAAQELEQALERPVRITLDAIPQNANGSSTPPPAEDEEHVATEWLHVRGDRIGKIHIDNNPDDPLTEDAVSLIQSISRQVSEALEYVRLLEQTQKRAVELETVSQVGIATSTILESERLLQSVVDLTKQSFDLYHVQIYLLDAEQDSLILVAGSGEVGAMMKSQNWRVSLDREGLLTQVARSREGIIVNDIRREPYYKPNPLLPATRAELAAPMIAGNRLMGVFDVHADRPGVFSNADIVIQNALATQIAVALQNAMLYEEQIQTAEKLREVERLKSEFLASMSHELRTPLNSIIGFADVLLEGLDGELNPRMMEDVQLIRDSGQYLRELIGDILDMSKIEAGKMKLRYELIDVPELADEIMANSRTLAVGYQKEHLAIATDVKPNVTTVYADRTRLKQVIYNLLSNAIKFTETGQIRLAMRYEDDWFLVSVADTGIGIRQEDLQLIFEQFRQVDNTLTGVAGTGLGLPISKSLIELHGGYLRVESTVGQGTNFWFKIPRYGAGYHMPETGTLLGRVDI